MDDQEHPVSRLSHFVHKNLLWLVLSSYAVAAVWPRPGESIRDVSFGTIAILGETTNVSLPTLMLTLLLFNAGLGVQTARLRNLTASPGSLVAGIAGNLVVPVAFVIVVS